MGPDSVTGLEVGATAIDIVTRAYAMTRMWPREEIYGLISQVRRASVSIPANIAEGAGRGNAGDFSRFAQIALGSAYELDTLLEISIQLKYSPTEDVGDLRDQVAHLMRGIHNLIRYQQSKRRATNH